jgi:hypothetical protein
MTRRHFRSIKRLTAIFAAGWVFGSLSCVTNVADTAGTSLPLTGVTGVLGDAGKAPDAIGPVLDLSADAVRLSPVIR